MALSKQEKIGLGVAAAAGVAALAVTFWPKSAAALPSSSSTGSGPFRVVLPGGAAPLASAGSVVLIDDGSGTAIMPILRNATEFSSPGETLQALAAAPVGAKAASGGPYVALVSVGYTPSGGDEGAYVRQIETNLHRAYDRVIWLVPSEMSAHDAIVANAKEYIEMVTHEATLDGLKSILYGGP